MASEPLPCDSKLMICEHYVGSLQTENALLRQKIDVLGEKAKQEKHENSMKLLEYIVLGALAGFATGVAIAK